MRIVAALLIACGLVTAAHAASTVKVDHVTLSAFTEAPAKAGGVTWVAIRQVIEPGWHTYWRNPGDSGLATSVSWTLPKGIVAGKPLWPVPQRFTDGPIVNYGYNGVATILVPLRAAAAVAGKAQATVSLLECQHMCIPEQALLDVDLGGASPPAVFAAARAALPGPFGGSVQASADATSLSLTMSGPGIAGSRTAQVYPETANAVDIDAPMRSRISGNTLVWSAARPAGAKPVPTFAAVVVLPGRGAYAVSAPVDLMATPSKAPEPSGNPGLIGAVLFAVLGGLILNLMPCVFPILSMKALALAQSGGDLRAARRDGLFYFAGVLATFSLAAGALLALRAGGAAIGWGFQLQSPPVVLALCLLTAAIGFNLLGAFEMPAGLAGMGDGLTRRGGGVGAFFTGALAVLVASPCTAPFMGAALGFALTAPPAEALAVFLALGVGFAAPFSLLAFTPALIRCIPKPGTWMVRFRQVLAFPMFATAIWLLWVLGQQTGATGMALALLIMLGLAFLLWLAPLLKAPQRVIAGIGVLAALIYLASAMHVTQPPDGIRWLRWTPQRVEQARQQGRPVFVDFSAAWCVTCLVNERVALDDARVAASLKKHGVAAFRADWTDHDAQIAAALARYHRSGVPLYVLYTPHGGRIILPQILTPATVLTALHRIETTKRPAI